MPKVRWIKKMECKIGRGGGGVVIGVGDGGEQSEVTQRGAFKTTELVYTLYTSGTTGKPNVRGIEKKGVALAGRWIYGLLYRKRKYFYIRRN